MKRQKPEDVTTRNQPAPPATTTVWDLPIRVFHWSLLCVVATAAVTGFLLEDRWLDVHVIAGYGLSVLLIFRILWGFMGGRFSRFNAFPLSIEAVWRHLRSLARRRSRLHAGHNPAGAVMIVALLGLLTSIALTGFVTLGGQENLGPLAALAGFDSGRLAGELHEFLAWLLAGAVTLHVGGIILETTLFRHPLVRAMITGRKPLRHDGEGSDSSFALRGLAVLALAAIAILVPARVMSSFPGGGWRPLPRHDTYRQACGECHNAYHPSLRTAAQWRTIVGGLSDHFGEDASLGEATSQSILAYLEGNDAATFDTEASNRIGLSPTPGIAITSTEYWVKRHKALSPEIFKRRGIGSRANCNACHTDAGAGRFDDHAIAVPGEISTISPGGNK